MNDTALVLRQVRFTNKAFWRNPASAFFTFAFPLMFLVIFTSLLGGDVVEVAPGVVIEEDRYFVAAMGTFAVISATFTNLAIGIAFTRDAGILKRTRGTPLPAWFYVTDVPTGTNLLQFLVTIIIGATAFSALGLATTAIVPNADAAPPIVNAIILPLLFLSGIFIPLGEDAPQWLKTVGNIFPVKHFSEASMGSFYGSPLPFEWMDVLFVAAWGLVGLVLAARYFSWEPRK